VQQKLGLEYLSKISLDYLFLSLLKICMPKYFDSTGSTVLASASTNEKAEKMTSNNLSSAKAIGQKIAERAIEAGIKKVVFDRSGYKYHGRIKAIAESAREAGLEF
jgi:large subunit ribosomal protein L18